MQVQAQTGSPLFRRIFHCSRGLFKEQESGMFAGATGRAFTLPGPANDMLLHTKVELK